MAFVLTDYQIAALQEMQIPVWQGPQKHSEQQIDSPIVSKNVKSEVESQDKARSHLQRLRDNVSGQSTASKPVEKNADVKEITAQEAPQFFADLTIATQDLAIETILSVKVGLPISATQTGITLPVAPNKLNSLHKKQLWQALCALR